MCTVLEPRGERAAHAARKPPGTRRRRGEVPSSAPTATCGARLHAPAPCLPPPSSPSPSSPCRRGDCSVPLPRGRAARGSRRHWRERTAAGGPGWPHGHGWICAGWRLCHAQRRNMQAACTGRRERPGSWCCGMLASRRPGCCGWACLLPSLPCQLAKAPVPPLQEHEEALRTFPCTYRTLTSCTVWMVSPRSGPHSCSKSCSLPAAASCRARKGRQLGEESIFAICPPRGLLGVL